VEAVVKGVGAPFSTTPQATAAEAEGSEQWARHDHHIHRSFGTRSWSWFEPAGSRRIWPENLECRRCRFGLGYDRQIEIKVFGKTD